MRPKATKGTQGVTKAAQGQKNGGVPPRGPWHSTKLPVALAAIDTPTPCEYMTRAALNATESSGRVQARPILTHFNMKGCENPYYFCKFALCYR